MDEEIIKNNFYTNGSYDSRKWRNSQKDEIREILNKFNQYSTLAEKVYACVNGVGKCMTCLNTVKLNSFSAGWKMYCSQKCAQKNNLTRIKSQQTCLKRHGGKTIWEIPGYKEKISKNISKSKRQSNIKKLENFKCPEYEIRNINDRWQWKHICGEEWESKILRQKMTCPRCASSKPEEEIIKFILSISPNSVIKRRDRVKLYPKELDILIDDKLAIEYNGAYWHRNATKTQAQSKTVACNKLGIKLLTIVESDWKFNREKVLNLIETALCPKIKISARKLVAKNISKKEASDFLEKYHFNGNAACAYCIGLVDEHDNLLMVATFGKNRFSKIAEYELIRLCSRKDVFVRGGISKLISQWRKTNTSPLISYHDLKFGWSDSLSKANFQFVDITSPGWRWIKGNNVLERWQTQKKKILKIIPDADLSKTEIEIMRGAGWIQEFNVGNIKWKLN